MVSMCLDRHYPSINVLLGLLRLEAKMKFQPSHFSDSFPPFSPFDIYEWYFVFSVPMKVMEWAPLVPLVAWLSAFDTGTEREGGYLRLPSLPKK